MTGHRKPPKPSYIITAQRGYCRFCGEPIIEEEKINRRKNWHADCGRLWFLMNNPAEARKHVLRRDKRTCQECGTKKGPFEVDHRKPLFEAEGDLDYWKPDNLILLCRPCHVEKTRTDMDRFRERLREAVEQPQTE